MEVIYYWGIGWLSSWKAKNAFSSSWKLFGPVVENEIKVVSMTISFTNWVNYHQEEVIPILMNEFRSIPRSLYVSISFCSRLPWKLFQPLGHAISESQWLKESCLYRQRLRPSGWKQLSTGKMVFTAAKNFLLSLLYTTSSILCRNQRPIAIQKWDINFSNYLSFLFLS